MLINSIKMSLAFGFSKASTEVLNQTKKSDEISAKLEKVEKLAESLREKKRTASLDLHEAYKKGQRYMFTLLNTGGRHGGRSYHHAFLTYDSAERYANSSGMHYIICAKPTETFSIEELENIDPIFDNPLKKQKVFNP